jgi:hypothetical protein
MAQKEPDAGPSLELPSLFGRRKRRTQSEGDTQTVAPADEEVTPTVPDHVDSGEPDHTAVIPVVQEPVAEEPAARERVVETPVAPEPVVEEPTVQTPVVEPPPQPAAPAATPTPVPQPTPQPTPVVEPARTQREAQDDEDEVPAPAAATSRKDHRKRSAPELAASTAAFLVGAVIGLMGCVLTVVGLQGCEWITGTGSCGGPGLLVLVVILVAMILVGTVALRRLNVPEAGNVSFLGVGIMTAIALMFLIDYLYDLWMFLVIPVLTAVSYAVARWITTMYAEDLDNDDGGLPHHDVR